MTRDDNRRPEVAIVAAFAVAASAAVTFAVAYGFDMGTQALGACLAVAFGGVAVGLTIWARRLLQTGGYVEEHEGFSSPAAQTADVAERLTEVSRPHRRGLLAMLGVALASILGALLVPLKSLMQPRGEHPVRQLSQTVWRTGHFRLVDADGKPVRISDVSEQTILTVFPEGHTEAGDVPAFVVRLDPARMASTPPGGDVDGVTAFSLLCTHAGCPVSLYEQSTGQMLCPCHQSVFDLLDGARPVSGPAARPLPGLPIEADDRGFLYGTGDFSGPPGAGYWSRP